MGLKNKSNWCVKKFQYHWKYFKWREVSIKIIPTDIVSKKKLNAKNIVKIENFELRWKVFFWDENWNSLNLEKKNPANIVSKS